MVVPLPPTMGVTLEFRRKDNIAMPIVAALADLVVAVTSNEPRIAPSDAACASRALEMRNGAERADH